MDSSKIEVEEESRQPAKETISERNSNETTNEDPPLTPGRAKLQSWLYKYLRIVLTDGRILTGSFLCTDSDANVILGMCSEDTHKGGEERMLGLVMVPGRHIVSMEMDMSGQELMPSTDSYTAQQREASGIK